MNYQNKHLCRIRTITTFLCLDRDKSAWPHEIEKASAFCSDLCGVFQHNGYTVQTIRIVTNPFAEYLNTDSLQQARNDLRYLSELLDSSNTGDIRVRFAIGEAVTAQEIRLVPDLIKEFGDLCNVCVNVSADDNDVLDNDLIHCAAEAVVKISQITHGGEGNFNFTVNFNCDPLIPYFPASYHRTELGNRFVIGLETPDLLMHVLEGFNQRHDNLPHNERLNHYFELMREALQFHVSGIQKLIAMSGDDKGFTFSGFDSSAAPSKNCASMVDVYKQMGVEYFGAAGTIEASSLLTRMFKSIKGVDLVGFSGLMLALTEDRGLARGSIQSHFDIRALLTYSAVCGIGLDTVPVPGDTSIDKIAALMRDTGTLAYRLNKPLTVRLFPLPGKAAGDMTAFESDDLCDCAVLEVP